MSDLITCELEWTDGKRVMRNFPDYQTFITYLVEHPDAAGLWARVGRSIFQVDTIQVDVENVKRGLVKE